MMSTEGHEDARYGPPQSRPCPTGLIPVTIKHASSLFIHLESPQPPPPPMKPTFPLEKNMCHRGSSNQQMNHMHPAQTESGSSPRNTTPCTRNITTKSSMSMNIT